MQEIIAKAKTSLKRMLAKIRSWERSASEEASDIVRDVKTEEIFVAEVAKKTLRMRFERLRRNLLEIVEKRSQTEILTFIFIFGIIVGFGVKMTVSEYVTIGYRDYTTQSTNTYNLVKIQKEVSENGGLGVFSGSSAQVGGTCQ